MYKLRWSLPARRDLQEIFHYYSNETEDCDIELGQEILRRIVLPTQALATLPLAGRPGRIRNTREILAENAPYVIV